MLAQRFHSDLTVAFDFLQFLGLTMKRLARAICPLAVSFSMATGRERQRGVAEAAHTV